MAGAGESIMNMGRKKFFLALALGGLVIGSSFSLRAEHWSQWRGPFFNGSTTEKGLSTRFSKTENVKSVADLPGPAAATSNHRNLGALRTSAAQEASTLQALC